MSLKSIRPFLLPAASVLVIGAMIALNPQFRIFPQEIDAHFNEPSRYPPEPGPAGLATGESQISFQARGGERRQGQVFDVAKFDATKSWSFEPLNGALLAGSKGSPAVDASGIYVGSDSGRFYKLNFEGKKIWEHAFLNSRLGILSSPVLDQDSVYLVTPDAVIYAFDKESGKVRYSRKLGSWHTSSAVFSGGSLYVVVLNRIMQSFVVKLNPRTGETIWSSTWLGSGATGAVVSPEAGLLSVAVSGRKVVALSLEDGSVKWGLDVAATIRAPAASADGVFYYVDERNGFSAIEASSGKLRYRVELADRALAAPWIDPQSKSAFVGTPQSVQALSLESGKVLWSRVIKRAEQGRQTPGGIFLVNAQKQKALLTACTNQEFCLFDTQTGKELGRKALPSDLVSTPVGFNGRVYMALSDAGGLLSFVF